MYQNQKMRKTSYSIILLALLLLLVGQLFRETVFAAERSDISKNLRIRSESEDLITTNDIGGSGNTTILLSETDITLGLGESMKLNPSLNPVDASDIISYESLDNTIVTVDASGVVTALKEGTTNIVASLSNGNKAECKITVLKAPEGILISYTTKTLKSGNTYTIQPELSGGFTYSGFTYTSSDESIAVVAADGKVTAESSGTAKITIHTYNGLTSTFNIRVVDNLASFDVQYIPVDSLYLAKGQTRILYYKVSPSSQESYVRSQVTWSSSNTKVVSVTSSGKLTAKSTGKATITLNAKDGSAKKLNINVTVAARKSGTNYSESNMSIVSTSNAAYTYSEMVEDLNKLENKYGDIITVDSLGKSYDNRNLYEVILGNPSAKEKVIIQSAIHGREYMTAMLTMRQIEFYCKNYYTSTYSSKYFSEIFDDVAFYIMPMVNPDGVTISQYGPSGIKSTTLRNKVKEIAKKNGGGSAYYRTWKANVRGVDLNRNFDQYWEILQGNEPRRSAYGYKGPSAVSEVETKTLVNLFLDIKPAATISYHATGSIIYWDYGQTGSLRTESGKLRDVARSLTNYSLVKGFSKYHATGFSDWVSINQRTPAITIEIGTGTCPLKLWEFNSVWSKNKLIFIKTAELYR